MSHQTTATAVPATAIAPGSHPVGERLGPRWLAGALLITASALLLALAGASAWLSYRAQVAYVLAHDGHAYAQAQVWALLLDTGTAGVSLLRLYEALTGHQKASTHTTLTACIGASVVMNLLHAPSRTAGGYLVAAVPPIMYAVLLEHLLTNLRILLCTPGSSAVPARAALLWLHFPATMWRTWRDSLRYDLTTAPARRDVLEQPSVPQNENNGAEQRTPYPHPVDTPRRRGRRLGDKRLAFEDGLIALLRSGDLRPLSSDERERNAAAYQVAESLPAPLSRGTAHRYSVQALARLHAFTEEDRDSSTPGG